MKTSIVARVSLSRSGRRFFRIFALNISRPMRLNARSASPKTGVAGSRPAPPREPMSPGPNRIHCRTRILRRGWWPIMRRPLPAHPCASTWPGMGYAQYFQGFQYPTGRVNGAQKRTRTSTTLRSPAPEAGASTNSAIWARGRSGRLAARASACQPRRTGRHAFYRKAVGFAPESRLRPLLPSPLRGMGRPCGAPCAGKRITDRRTRCRNSTGN